MNCVHHAGVAAEAACPGCARAVCQQCGTRIDKEFWCVDCLRQAIGAVREARGGRGRRAKSPALAVVLSLLLPGAGHIYAEQYVTGLAIPLVLAAAAAVLVGYTLLSRGLSPFISPLWLAFVVVIVPVAYVFAAIDAYNAALRSGRRNYLPNRAAEAAGALRRGDAAVWGIALLGFGTIALLRVMGVWWLPGLWRLWSLVLVGAGAYLAVRACRSRR